MKDRNIAVRAFIRFLKTRGFYNDFKEIYRKNYDCYALPFYFKAFLGLKKPKYYVSDIINYSYFNSKSTINTEDLETLQNVNCDWQFYLYLVSRKNMWKIWLIRIIGFLIIFSIGFAFFTANANSNNLTPLGAIFLFIYSIFMMWFFCADKDDLIYDDIRYKNIDKAKIL